MTASNSEARVPTSDRTGSLEAAPTTMAAIPTDRATRLALSSVIEGGEPAVAEVTAVSGASAAWQQVCDGRFGEGLAERAAALDLDRVLARAARSRARFVVPGDEEWPERLGDLRYCDEVQRRGGVPFGLWLRGPGHLSQLAERSVAIVGSRTATPYGTTVATDLGAELAEAGFTVVSGGAYGIDTAAHQGALAAAGPTIAVVANGVDVAYPQGNRKLFDWVGEHGLIVSELAPGTHPSRVRFLARNRLIAALSRGVVVVEAAVRSGALNTASWASGLGRTVMGVPGPVTSAPSAGVHQLIRARDALLVTSGEEVLEAVAPMGSFTLVEPREDERPRDRLEARERQVLDAVPLVRAADSASIARSAGVAHGRTKDALLALHRAGLVEHSLGRWRVVTDSESP